MITIEEFWATEHCEHAELFSHYEQLLSAERMHLVPDQQRFGKANLTCYNLTEMEDAGYQAREGQNAFQENNERNKIAEQMVANLTPRQLEAARNLILGKADNADYCCLKGLRKKYKDMTWLQIVAALTNVTT